jgi:hypothetical protein
MMKITDGLGYETRLYLISYLRKFKHSTLAKKLALCVYNTHLVNADLAEYYFKSFLVTSTHGITNGSDEELISYWRLKLQHVFYFYGIPKNIILKGTLHDVELEIDKRRGSI